MVCVPGEKGSTSAVGSHLGNPKSDIPGKSGVSSLYDPGNLSLHTEISLFP